MTSITTKEEAIEAVRKNGLALEYVPKKLIDKEVCLEAIRTNGLAFQFVPENLIDKEICLEAVKDDSWEVKIIKLEKDCK